MSRNMRDMADARVITFWMDNQMIEDLDERAQQAGVCRSVFVKDVLRQAIETPPPGRPSPL